MHTRNYSKYRIKDHAVESDNYRLTLQLEVQAFQRHMQIGVMMRRK
jgi:hypothetical protein